MCTRKDILRTENVKKYFPLQGSIFSKKENTNRAVDGVSLNVMEGEIFGLVGESGCGKSTLGRTILQLYRPTSGKVFFNNVDLCSLKGKELRALRKNMQMIFQDPYASLNPRKTIGESIAEPLVIYKACSNQEVPDRVKALLESVGMNSSFYDRYPHEFSGGQRQRVGIARALALEPQLVICDEPISALDVSIQAQIVNLLKDLQEQHGLAYLVISHDLSMVRYISDRVGVMYLGVLVELAERDELYSHPLHPYTNALLSSIPEVYQENNKTYKTAVIEGDVSFSEDLYSGCRFRTRCPVKIGLCSDKNPDWREVSSGHWVACHLI